MCVCVLHTLIVLSNSCRTVFLRNYFFSRRVFFCFLQTSKTYYSQNTRCIIANGNYSNNCVVVGLGSYLS